MVGKHRLRLGSPPAKSSNYREGGAQGTKLPLPPHRSSSERQAVTKSVKKWDVSLRHATCLPTRCPRSPATFVFWLRLRGSSTTPVLAATLCQSAVPKGPGPKGQAEGARHAGLAGRTGPRVGPKGPNPKGRPPRAPPKARGAHKARSRGPGPKDRPQRSRRTGPDPQGPAARDWTQWVE